ncbi:hypothetical protein, partial [Streptomyces sp. NPDC059169]|uniref:hypothetical protein n=1 Tax=unclassified Streptomyces TaxID=2593676 RepID=UPI00369E9363
MPCIDIGLLALPDCAPSVGEPCEEGAGLGDFLLGVVGLGASQGCLLCLCPQVPQLVPDGEVPQKLTVFGFLDGGEPFGQPALVEQELPVDSREDTAVHKQVTSNRQDLWTGGLEEADRVLEEPEGLCVDCRVI